MRIKATSFLSYIFLTAIALTILTACRDERGYDDKYIYVGEIVSLTGSESTFGTSSHRGVSLAINEFNLNNPKRKIKLIAVDNQSNKEKSAKILKNLIKKQNIIAVIGEVVSERTKYTAPIAQKNKIPMISPAATNPGITDIGDYIFRACFIDPFQGFAMAKFAREHLKVNTVVIFKDFHSNYSAGLSEYFVDTFTDLGGEILGEESYNSKDTDFSEQILKAKKLKPDAIFIPGYYSEVAEIAKQIRKSNIRSRKTGSPTLLLGGDGWDSSELYARGGKAVLGSYFTTHFSPQSKDPIAVEFINKYQEQYKLLPDGQAALGYDAAKILLHAIEKTFSTDAPTEATTKIRDEIAKTKKYPGVTGSITLNENRDAVKPAVILRVRGLKNSYVTTILP